MKASLVIVLASCEACEAGIGHPCNYLQRPARSRVRFSRAPGLHPKPHRVRVAAAERVLPPPPVFHVPPLGEATIALVIDHDESNHNDNE